MADPGSDAREVVSKARLEFLCDGIFAIAMTILVLELKVPDLQDRHSVAELARGLLGHASTFVSYLLSFLMLGMFWTRHNAWYRQIEKMTKGVLAVQLFQLAVAAFFPFCAALLGRYPTNPLSMSIYLGCVATYLWSGAFLWIVARRAGALEMPPDYRRNLKAQLVANSAITLLLLFYLVRAVTGH